MTENGAIKELETSIDLAQMCTQNYERKNEIQGYEMAIKALEEVQQYRAIGTPEECLEAVTKQISRHPVDKTKPDSGYGNYYENARVIVCPNCNGRLKLKSKGKYCDKCGQKLNWENA